MYICGDVKDEAFGYKIYDTFEQLIHIRPSFVVI